MKSLQTRVTRRFASTADARDGLIMTGATVVAGGFDYLVLVAAGLLLSAPAALGFLAVMNLLKIAEQITWVMRNVVAYYVANTLVDTTAGAHIGAFLRRRWGWAWRWGGAAAFIFGVLAAPLSRLLGIGSASALAAAAAALLLLFLRPVTDGALQGAQRFRGLGVVVIVQAVLRFGLTILLIELGLALFGAVLALPLASSAGLALGYWFLRDYLRAPDRAKPPRVSRRYSTLTLVGLSAFAVLVYSDAILVNRLFAEATAVSYTPVVILARINLFVPLALGMVFFPKATQRYTLGRDARGLLALTLLATLLPGLLLAALFFLAPELIVGVVFRGQYGNPGALLGWVGLATALFAGANIWLNDALSRERRAFVGGLALLAGLQVSAIFLWASSLQDVAAVLVVSGLLANGAGFVLSMRRRGNVGAT